MSSTSHKKTKPYGIAPLPLLIAVFSFMFAPTSTYGIATEVVGPERPVGLSLHWPLGTWTILNHPSRVYYVDVNSSISAYYDGDLDMLMELVWLLGEIRVDVHELKIETAFVKAASVTTFGGERIWYRALLEVPRRVAEERAAERRAAPQFYALVTTRPAFPVVPRLTLYADLDPKSGLGSDEIQWLTRMTNKTPAAKRLRQLKEGLKHPSVLVQCVAANQLADMGSAASSAVDALSVLLNDDSDYVRASAARAIGRIGTQDTEVRSALRQLVKNPAQRVRLSADLALRRLNAAVSNADSQPATGEQPRQTPASRPATEQPRTTR